ncbi:hypothetical protein [Burkholderia pseudomallei]|uniref:hypothetical protein n=1 Tax=Burkholderia pseudomallei TaxID=28450 RepID=UPI0015C2D4F1|nr:hypothetical protein [Burkholderia pseudomallei]
MNFDLAYQGLMARLDSIFPVNPEKHELIEITVRRIHLHGELKKPFLTASFKPRIRTGRTRQIGRDRRPAKEGGVSKRGARRSATTQCEQLHGKRIARPVHSIFVYCLAIRLPIQNSETKSKIADG